MTVNSERIRTLATEVRAALDMLEMFKRYTKEQFFTDRSANERVRYNFIIAIQGMIDICNHIAARKARRAPTTYGDCFTVLAEIGILNKTLALNLKRLVGLRNILVHRYWQVDDEKIYDSLQNDLGIIWEYLSVVSQLNESKDASEFKTI